MLGGFWSNAGTALYCSLLTAGMQDSAALWYGCTVGTMVATFGLVLSQLPKNPKKSE